MKRINALSSLALTAMAAFPTLAEAACPDPGTAQPAVAELRGTSAPSGTTLVLGSAFPNPVTNDEKAGAFVFTQGETASRATTFPDPANATNPTPVTCSQYLRSFATIPASSANTFTVTIFGTPATFANLQVFKSDRNGVVGAAIGLSPLPAGSPNIPAGTSGATFTVSIPAGKAEAEGFTYRSSKPGTVNFYVQGNVQGTAAPSSAAALGSVSKPAGGTNFLPRLRFNTPARNVRAADCSPAVTVQTIDGDAVLSDVFAGNNSQIKIALSGAPADIFLDPSCTYPTTSMAIADPVPAQSAAGQKPQLIISKHEVTFYFKATQAQSFPITASHVNGNNQSVTPANRASQLQTITGQAPLAMELRGPAAVNQNECSAAVTLRLIDRYGNEAPTGSSRRINLSGGSAKFFSDAACASGIGGSINVATGATSQNFYIKDGNAESIKIFATDTAPTGQALQSDNLPLRVLGMQSAVTTNNPAVAKKLALRIWDRVTGLPASVDDPKIAQMSNLLLAGKAMDAAHVATDQDGFYNVTIKTLATSLSNRLGNPLEPLNDFVTTWIGIVRDGRSAQELLTGNHIYVGDTLRTPNDATCADSTVYKSNSHFAALTSSFANLRQKLVPVRQCVYNNDNFNADNPILLSDAAGLITTRTWGTNHMFAGTNRRALEYTFNVFACRKIGELADNSMPDWHIRRDVDRAPGGDPKIFTASCRSCHGGMDSMAGAFAFFDAYTAPNTNNMDDFRLFYVNKGGYGADAVMSKMNQNGKVYPPGWVSGDDSWQNYFTENQNQSLGWGADSKLSGNGVHSFGDMISKSQAFPSCMAKRVFKSVCKRDPYAAELPIMDELSQDFQASGFNMRRLYEKAATLATCLGNGEN